MAECRFDFSDETVGSEPKSFLRGLSGYWEHRRRRRQQISRSSTDDGLEGRPTLRQPWRIRLGRSMASVTRRSSSTMFKAYAYFPYAVRTKGSMIFRGGEISFRFQAGRRTHRSGVPASLFNPKAGTATTSSSEANALENNLVLFKYEKGKPLER